MSGALLNYSAGDRCRRLVLGLEARDQVRARLRREAASGSRAIQFREIVRKSNRVTAVCCLEVYGDEQTPQQRE